MKQRFLAFLFFLLLSVLTACAFTHFSSQTETAASSGSLETGIIAPGQTEPIGSGFDLEASSETERFSDSVPPETAAPDAYLSCNAVGKTVVHIPGPADNRPPYDYVFQPYAFSGIYKLAYGEDVEEEIRGFCDAVLAGEDSFPCTGRENWLHIDQIKDTMLPFCIYVSLYDPQIESGDLYFESLRENGRYPLYYKLPKDEYLSVVEQFKSRIAELITQADLREGDSDMEKALKLYTASSLRIAYDYADVGPFNCYRVLMGDYGICQEIAPAYAYLLLQVGVDAGICGSLSKDGDSAHAWTMVKLNDTWYHADVTWQLSDPYGLRYFLIDDDDRDASGFDLQFFNIGEINEIWHRDFPVDDNSFSQFWNVKWYTIDHDAICIEYYDDPWLNYQDLTTYQTARKTLPLR